MPVSACPLIGCSLALRLNCPCVSAWQVIGCSLALVELVIRKVPDGAHRVMDLDAEVIENLQVSNRPTQPLISYHDACPD